MIDLSHLTEEEQEAILTVLRRDADLKRAEEERVRKLEKVLPSSQPGVKLKYLTGEWFYEAKSRRHNDKIHGSEIILAAMKQGKTSSVDASPRLDRSRTPGSQGSDIVAPPKPARCFDMSEPQEKNDAEKENRYSGVRSTRPARHNPFNRPSLTVVEHPENRQDLFIKQDQDLKETEPVSSLKNPPAGDSSQTSGGSITSESSSVGFRPVPKKRTLLLSHSQLQINNQPWSDAEVQPAEVVPAPRRRHQRGSISNPSSCFKSKDETPREDIFNISLQPTKAGEEVSPQLLRDTSQISSKPGLEGEQNVTRDRPAVFNRTEVNTGRESATWNIDEDLKQRERAASNGFNIQETFGRGEELSSTQSSADPDPPVSYDLKFIDKSAQQRQNQKSVFKLSTQTPSPTGEDEDSIAKVLEWFDRSTESNDWLDAEDEPKASERVDKHATVRKSGGKDSFDGASKTKRRPRRGSEELTERQEDVWKDTRGKIPVQDVGNNAEENQPIRISNLKSFWEQSNTGPKVLFSKAERPGLNSDAPSDPERYSERVTHDKSSSDLRDNREKQLLSDQLNDYEQEETMKFNSNHRKNDDSAHLKLLPSYEVSNRRAENSSITRPDASTVEYQSIKPKLQPESKQSLSKDLLSNTHPESGADPQTIGLDSEKLILSSMYVDYKRDGSEEQVATKPQVPRGLSEDEDKDKRLSAGVSNRESSNSQASRQQESTAEKIKQLKSFWEQELNKPMSYTRKPKSQARLNKRFTKSEFDLTSVGNESGSDDDGGYKNTNFNVPLSPRLDKMSPSLGASRAQFNTLREFWDEATSDSRAPVTPEKLKSPKRKEPQQVQLSTQELRSADPELYPFSSAVVTKSYPSQKSRSKTPLDRATGSKVQNDSSYIPDEAGQRRLSKRISKEFSQEEKPLKLQSSKEIRSPKNRKDSFSFSSSRGNSLRRATSMFALSVPDDKDQNQLRMEVNPIQFQSRKPRQKTDRGPQSRGSSNESETLAPLARAFVPSDYRHYLGMTDSSSDHAAFKPPTEDHPLEVKSGYKPDLGVAGPLAASTPTSSEDRPVRKTHKTSQYPAWADYTESDTGHESSISSASETWSNSKNCSNRVNDADLNPVRKALWRAEARPRNLAKSLEDVTAPPRQERRPDQSVDLRRSSNTSTTPSPSASSFSDPDHLKKMSKSVPSFLQKEDDDGREAGGLTAGSSMTALSASSGTASLSGSVMTMYSGDFVEVQGNIQFSINYVQKLREFHIFVAECRDLAAVDPKRNRSDPYVKSYLVPDKANLGKRKTSVKKKTLNPKFNEILRYRVRMEYLHTQTLILSVWHHDTFGKNSFLGEVDVDLSKWDSDHTQMNYLALKAKTIPSIAPINSGRGEMRLALRFLPQITHSEGLTKDVSNTGEIHIWVKECKNLPLIRATIDPYVKCFVLPDTSRKSRQKTRVLRRSADPVFNHTMVYDGINETDLSDICVELTVWDRDRLTSNLLGGLRLGAGTGRSYGALVDWMDSGPYEVTLWDRMIASPNEWVEDVLPLRMLISARRVFK